MIDYNEFKNMMVSFHDHFSHKINEIETFSIGKISSMDNEENFNQINSIVPKKGKK